jgi:hypothetical protein
MSNPPPVWLCRAREEFWWFLYTKWSRYVLHPLWNPNDVEPPRLLAAVDRFLDTRRYHAQNQRDFRTNMDHYRWYMQNRRTRRTVV